MYKNHTSLLHNLGVIGLFSNLNFVRSITQQVLVYIRGINLKLLVAINSMGKRELVALRCLSSWCLVIVVGLFFTIPRVSLKFVIVVFPDHTYYFQW